MTPARSIDGKAIRVEHDARPPLESNSEQQADERKDDMEKCHPAYVPLSTDEIPREKLQSENHSDWPGHRANDIGRPIYREKTAKQLQRCGNKEDEYCTGIAACVPPSFPRFWREFKPWGSLLSFCAQRSKVAG
jgi:hypothetical protein